MSLLTTRSRDEILYGQDRYRCQGCGHQTDALYVVLRSATGAAMRCRACRDRRNDVIRRRLPLMKEESNA